MSFDLAALGQAVSRHETVTRVVVAAVEGSAPREPGASMLVWPGGQSGTIGGGALEHGAARAALDGPFVHRVPLGPAIGQCCGGAVTLVGERFTAADLGAIGDPFLRRVEGTGEAPLALLRAAAAYRRSGAGLAPRLDRGWFVEPLSHPRRALWVYGAGHVGRALVTMLAPLPDFDITWIDTAASRFPDPVPDGVTPLTAVNPGDAVRHAPANAEHLVLTYSHALDLDLCHRILGRPFAGAGLIGSATKWARFRSRLAALGHPPERIARIACPIGDPSLGKHPQAIAVSVAAALLRRRAPATAANWGESA